MHSFHFIKFKLKISKNKINHFQNLNNLPQAYYNKLGKISSLVPTKDADILRQNQCNIISTIIKKNSKIQTI